MPANNKEDYAVVFSGGGAFGAWEVGAYEAILSRYQQKPPAIVTGASSGALNAAALCAGMSVEELKKLWQSLTRQTVFEPKLTSWDLIKAVWLAGGSLSRGAVRLLESNVSLLSTSPLQQFLDLEFRERISAFFHSGMTCVVSVTQLNHRRTEFYYKPAANTRAVINGNDPEAGDFAHWTEIESLDTLVMALMGSTAIPILFPPCEPTEYFDGGILLNQPIEAARQLGARVIYILTPSASKPGDAKNVLRLGNTLLSTWMSASLTIEIARVRELNLEMLFDGRGNGPMTKLCVIRPKKDLSLEYPGTHLLSFGDKAKELINDGYRTATHDLNNFDIDEPATWQSNPYEHPLAPRKPFSVSRSDNTPTERLNSDDSSEVDEHDA